MLPPFAFPIGAIPIDRLAEEHSEVVRDLQDLDAVVTATTFGGLLLTPELQSNCLRLEVLAHLAIAYCAGSKHPTRACIIRAFERVGRGFCGHAEDPSEDVFVTSVSTPRGNYRILQGIRESPGFCLQRVLNVIERMPQDAPFSRIRTTVDSILRFSEAIVARAQLAENTLGAEVPVDTLPRKVADRLATWRAMVRFSDEELKDLRLPVSLLGEFIFNPVDTLLSPSPGHGHSALERRPILVRAGTAYLVLPTAISTAVTRFVIETVLSMNLRWSFERALAREVADAISKTPLIGEAAMAHLPFQQFTGGWTASFSTPVDAGRFAHVMVFVDGVEEFSETGFSGTNAAPEALGNRVDEYLRRSITDAETRADFREGIFLIVVAGLGRTIRFPLQNDYPPNWRVEMISAADLVTLSFMHRFDWLALWKLLDSRRIIEQRGVTFLNVSGLLNLAAWADELDGHLVVHHSGLPNIGRDARALIIVRQNALRDARRSVASQYQTKRVLDTKGNWLLVRKTGPSLFPEDDSQPLYVSEDDLERGELKGVYVSARRPWWLTISASAGSPRGIIYEYWQMLCTWFRRAAPILDMTYERLPIGPIQLEFRFGRLAGSRPGRVRQVEGPELNGLVQVNASSRNSIIVISVADSIEGAIQRPENIAERMIVEAMVAGVATVDGDESAAKAAQAAAAICPNSEARHIHSFQARNMRDHLTEQLDRKPTVIDRLDSASCRIGLGWKTRSPDAGAEIHGIEECTAYLNATVNAVIADIRSGLKRFGRQELVTVVLHNHERAAHDRERWRRTAQATLALRQDKVSAMRVIVEHEGELNAVFLSSRILLEAAICECPTVGEHRLGEIDLASLLAQASMVFHLGGFSDAIHWGAVEPRILISTLGDVQMNHEFFDSVYVPFGQVGSEARVVDAADSYPRLYEEPQPLTDTSTLVERQFFAAWRAEIGITVDGLRAVLDRLDDAALEQSEPILQLKRSELLRLIGESTHLSPEEADVAVVALSLSPRSRWDLAPVGFIEKDWQPWRFRRRLSVLRRPLIQVDEAEDSLVIVAPSFVRSGFAYSLAGFHSGEVPQWQARSPEMQSWLGSANHRHRLAFNTEVAKRLRDLGWRTDEELTVTKLLGQSFDKNYGDVDVLAWSPQSGRVLAIECKDLQYKKTPGEVAEQLADYRGEMKSDGKPDDLRKHLDRVDLIKANSQRVASYLNLPIPIQIEGHLVFKNPVPMRFAWAHMAVKIRLSLFADLNQI